MTPYWSSFLKVPPLSVVFLFPFKVYLKIKSCLDVMFSIPIRNYYSLNVVQREYDPNPESIITGVPVVQEPEDELRPYHQRGDHHWQEDGGWSPAPDIQCKQALPLYHQWTILVKTVVSDQGTSDFARLFIWQ